MLIPFAVGAYSAMVELYTWSRISCLKAVDDFPEQCDIHLQDNDDLVNKYKKGHREDDSRC